MIKFNDHPDANCKGCKSYMGNNNCACQIDFRHHESICPCSVCITKPMCVVDCEEYNEYSYIFVAIPLRGEGMKPFDKCKQPNIRSNNGQI